MAFENVTIGLSFIAGIASFLSPCVLALVPAYIGYLSGRAAGVAAGQDNKLITFLHGIAFVLGFSFVFITLGVFSSALGGWLIDIQVWLGRVGGLIVIVFGLHMIGILRIPFLEMDGRFQMEQNGNYSLASSFLMGIFFSAGWSPCVGPVLGAILTLAMNGGEISQGLSLLSAYSLGMAIPFLLAALGIGWVSTLLKKFAKVMRITEVVMGSLMVVVGFLLMTGAFNKIAILFPGWSTGL